MTMVSSTGLIGSLILALYVFGLSGCRLDHGVSDRRSAAKSSPSSVAVAAPPPLIEATLAGDVEKVASQLQTGTDPNLVYHTNTALTYAARDGFTEIAHLLIAHGAEVNWIDGEGVTPLILAAFKGHVDLTKLLLEHDADPTVIDQWDRTALDYALRRGESDPIVQLLQAVQ